MKITVTNKQIGFVIEGVSLEALATLAKRNPAALQVVENDEVKFTLHPAPGMKNPAFGTSAAYFNAQNPSGYAAMYIIDEDVPANGAPVKQIQSFVADKYAGLITNVEKIESGLSAAVTAAQAEHDRVAEGVSVG